MNRKKLIAFSISLAMTVVPVTPAAAAGAEQNTEGLQNAVLDLEFENSLEDSSGKGNNGTLSSGEAEYVDGVVGKGLKMNGSSYVNLGNSTDLQPENLTLSFWIRPDSDMKGEELLSWNKNEWYTDGWYLSSENDNTPLTLSVGPAKANGQPYRVSVSGKRSEFLPTGEWTHIAVTYDKDSKEICFYRNGVKCSTVTTYGISGESTGVLGSDATMEKSIGYNGPKYKGAYLKAFLDEYQLYNDVATPEEVIALYEESGQTFDRKAVAQADLDKISIPETTQENLSLPTTGESGSVISWSSDNEAMVAADGTVVRPGVGEKDVTVTLTAEASYLNGEKVTKTYKVTVTAKQEINITTSSIMGDVTLEDDYLVNAA